MSHNSKYYAKKTRKKDVKGTPTIQSLWNKASTVTNVAGSSCQVSEDQMGGDGHSCSTVTDTSLTDNNRVSVDCNEPISVDTRDQNCNHSRSPQPDPYRALQSFLNILWKSYVTLSGMLKQDK